MKLHFPSYITTKRHHTSKRLKNVRYLTNFLIVALTFLLMLPTIHSQNQGGIIHGALIDGKSNKPIANHPVTLNIHKRDDVTQQETKTDENGHYHFEKLPIEFETHYSITTTYDNTEYEEKDLVLSSFVSNLVVDINIGGVTDDPAQIRLKTYSIALGFASNDDIAKGILSIIEVFVIENTSTLPFQMTQNDETVSLYFALPKGYEQFKPLSPKNLRLNANADHAILTDPLKPGELEGGFIYTFHATGRDIQLSRPMHFRTDHLTILVPEGINIAPRSKLFKSVGRTQFHGVVYTKYEASPESGFQKGKTPDLRIAFSNQQFTGQQSRTVSSNIGQIIFIAIAAALAGGFLVAAIFTLRGTRRQPTESDASQSSSIDEGWLRKLTDADLDHARTTRLEFITLLDTMNENKDISERVYNRLRKEQADRLTEILDQCKERGIDT